MTTAKPANWSESWHHRPVLRATEKEPRRPIIRKPENLPTTVTEGERHVSEVYWGAGNPMAWEDTCAIMEHGYPVRGKSSRTPCDIALFPAPSGLVILDCDVKEYDRETGFVLVKRNVARPLPPRVEYGLTDLQREVEKLGHSLVELATYTVETKSGGHHLYFRECEGIKLRTSGHRENWRVDVVAHNDGSDRSWVAAPPTENYTVVRDLPVAGMPEWLAVWLRDEMPKLEPVGGRRARQRQKQLMEIRDRAMTPGLALDQRNALVVEYAGWLLTKVARANEEGDWNVTIYGVMKDLLRVGYSFEQAAEMVMEHAAPVDQAEYRNAEYTVNSALRSHERDVREGRVD